MTNPKARDRIIEQLHNVRQSGGGLDRAAQRDALRVFDASEFTLGTVDLLSLSLAAADMLIDERIAELREPLVIANALVDAERPATKHAVIEAALDAGQAIYGPGAPPHGILIATIAAEVCERMMRSPAAVALAVLHLKPEHRRAVQVILDRLESLGEMEG